MSLYGIYEEKYAKLLPFRGCARFSSVAENHNKPFLQSPLLLLCQTLPDPRYFDPSASHMFTFMDTLTSRRMNYTLAKPL